KLNDGGNVSGANTATLTLTNVSGGDAANYAVVITNYVGSVTSAVASLTILSNAAPALDPISDRVVVAGATLTFTNSASDADQPAQSLSFVLLNAPNGAAVGAGDGVFTWRPLIAQGNSTNPMSVVVSDNGSPVLSATQSFTVVVTRPAAPQLQQFSLAGSQFSMVVNGDSGPDYTIQAGTNLINWENIFTTNSPAVPFLWLDDTTNFERRFYRVLLGP